MSLAGLGTAETAIPTYSILMPQVRCCGRVVNGCSRQFCFPTSARYILHSEFCIPLQPSFTKPVFWRRCRSTGPRVEDARHWK